MNRKHLSGALLIAATLVASGAYAQDPSPSPKTGAGEKTSDKVEKKAEKAADKVEKAGEKAADKVEKAGEKTADKAKSLEDRAARKAKEHDAQREKLKGVLKAPMNDSMKAELKRHAERVARLERVKSVADTEKDKDTSEKAAKLIGKEKDRHDKWMEKNATSTASVGTPTMGTPAAVNTGATPTPTPTPAAADHKGGAK